MLTRETLSTGSYQRSFDLPEGMLWERERIVASLNQTMTSQPEPGPIWVFAYGSLMWNPLLNAERQEVAVLDGWHRSFCLRMLAGRGSKHAPGRMLALEPGGQTIALALQLSPTTLREDLTILWAREMMVGSYIPTWVSLRLASGEHVYAIAFVADPTRDQYQSDSSVAAVSPLIAAASGPMGSNANYVVNLKRSLERHGISDPYIEGIAHLIDAPA